MRSAAAVLAFFWAVGAGEGWAAEAQTSPTAPEAALAAHRSARRAFYELKSDKGRGKSARTWSKLAARLADVYAQLAEAPKAPEALFLSARAWENAWSLSRSASYRKAALATCGRLCERHPEHRLCDDARLLAGRMHLRAGDTAAARKELSSCVALGGDMAPEADMLMRSLPAVRETARPKDGRDAEVLRSLAGAAKLSDGATLSAQMGLKVRRVVLDAGHGGKDTGAIGPGGLREKDATLDIVLALAALLEEEGYEVAVTRDDDSFLALERRSAIANEERADLFISVHLNSVPQQSFGGAETFTLNVASNRYAQRLAARENAASQRRVSDLQLILADLATKANTADSAKLAREVQRELALAHADPRKDHGVKQALFHVLVDAKMPSILVEAAFVSNPEEEKQLRTRDFRDRLARAIANGVERFVGDREELAQAEVE